MNNEDLKELNTIFKEMGGVEKVEDYTNNFENLVDGVYLGEIEKFETVNAKSNGKPMAVFTVALEGGRKCWVNMMLAGNNLQSTQTNVARTVTQLKKLGVDGVELEDFLIGAKELVGTKVQLTIKTSKYKDKITGEDKEFQNKSLSLA